MAGYIVHAERETGDKATRAGAASSQAEAGNIKIVRGPWNEDFLNELENFPPEKGHDDQVDALSGAVNAILKPISGGGLLGFAQQKVADAKKLAAEKLTKEKAAQAAEEKPQVIATPDGSQVKF